MPARAGGRRVVANDGSESFCSPHGQRAVELESRLALSGAMLCLLTGYTERLADEKKVSSLLERNTA